MASTQEFRKNMKLLIEGVPYVCLEAQFVKPGKGQAFTRCRLKNLVTGNVIERTWKSGETVELADIEQRKMQYIYPALANEFAEASSPLHVSSLFALGLILFAITFIVLSAAKLMLIRLQRQAGS